MKVSFGLGTATYHKVVKNDEFHKELLASPVEKIIDFIDTAPIYAHGRAESWLGEKISLSVNRSVITKVGLEYSFATRVGLKIPKGKTLYNHLFRPKIVRTRINRIEGSYAKSLKKLNGIQPFGLLLHSFDGTTVSIRQLSQLREIKKQNPRMRIGVSVDKTINELPLEMDILEIAPDFGTVEMLQNFHGILIINQAFKKNLTESQMIQLLQLDIEQLVILCGSTKVERIVSFFDHWQNFIDKENK
jgi:aryl-alcohol dehydrogenase-like predicted oxidoreductase